MLSLGLICFFKHPYRNTPILWNGSIGKWMHWCADCGDWRDCSRDKLERKMRDIKHACRGC